MNKMDLINKDLAKKELPEFNVGDTIKVITKIAEGADKFRFHPFEGVVIAKKGSGITETFTLRKMSYGEGIERIFKLYAPTIDSIEVLRSGKVKRAKLYYLRGKIGKHATRIEEKKEAKT